MSLKRSIGVRGLILAVGGFCVLLTVLPYKRYSFVSLFGEAGTDGSDSVFSLLSYAFTSSFDPAAILSTLPFLAIFSPLVILAEIAWRVPGRAYLLLQGILLLFSALWMLWIMSFSIFADNVRLLPTFYGVLGCVMVPAICSFVLTSRRIQNSFRCFVV